MSSIEGVKEAEHQLRILDERLGKGIGATRERAHLQSVIDGTYDPKPKPQQKAKALKQPQSESDSKQQKQKQKQQKRQQQTSPDPDPNFDKKLTAALRAGSLHGVDMKVRADRRR